MGKILEVENLTAGYGSPVVENISFSADTGEMVGILGRNGYGKTTLIRGITGAAKRFSGKILVQGTDCSSFSVRKLAQYISVLPQRTEVLPGMCAEKVIEMGCYPKIGTFGFPEEADKKKIKWAAVQLGITALLDTDCANLSAGQQQLIQLARILVQDTPVMLLDEPDAALDFYNTHHLFFTIRKLLNESGKAAVMVLHDPELALRWCDRFVILHEDKKFEILEHKNADTEEIESALRKIYP